MSIGISLQVEGVKNVQRGMEALIQHLGSDLRPMLDAVRSWWHTWQAEVFAGEGAPISQWEPLTAKYSRWKEKHYPGRPILELTGKLAGAMTGKASAGAWHRTGKREMEVGSRGIPYVFAQNFGVAKINLPARRFLDTSRAALRELDRSMMYVLADAKRDILRKMGGPGGMAR